MYFKYSYWPTNQLLMACTFTCTLQVCRLEPYDTFMCKDIINMHHKDHTHFTQKQIVPDLNIPEPWPSRNEASIYQRKIYVAHLLWCLLSHWWQTMQQRLRIQWPIIFLKTSWRNFFLPHVNPGSTSPTTGHSQITREDMLYAKLTNTHKCTYHQNSCQPNHSLATMIPYS